MLPIPSNELVPKSIAGSSTTLAVTHLQLTTKATADEAARRSEQEILRAYRIENWKKGNSTVKNLRKMWLLGK